MSVETHDTREFERYLDYQRQMRPRRIETLGGAATVLFLSTVDLGVTEVHDPVSEVHASSTQLDVEHWADITPLRAARQRRLAEFAEATELGYADAA